ncbi:ribonuclease P protein component [Propionibacteriaceae bacterium Y2011]|uniref:ribonuclease P protein component n=1 Tax=Microlunatus sp. Y2014 TaxID=3418488 RepID=UPI003B4CCA82
MLTQAHRMRRPDEFRHVIRRGVRAGRPTMVVHAAPRGGTTPDPTPPRVGFVVSKAVGNAVTRNRVKRRLRHLVIARLADTPAGTDWVVRALPPAATQNLADDFTSAWRTCLRRLAS